jgi:hypothetical protein
MLPLIIAACASTSTFSAHESELRPAEDTPVQFVTEEDSALVEDSCRSPLIDPRDQTRLRLVRSGAVGARHQGDYAVPAGRYGVRTGELLRIDCGSGQALGIVAN